MAFFTVAVYTDNWAETTQLGNPAAFGTAGDDGLTQARWGGGAGGDAPGADDRGRRRCGGRGGGCGSTASARQCR